MCRIRKRIKARAYDLFIPRICYIRIKAKLRECPKVENKVGIKMNIK